uniref:Uncharacterized protein n=1 Tax=Anguilla anguilla TaxID=7936 RepID=A0A0E9VHI8_ANGAN
MSGLSPVIARKPRATSTTSRASHTSLYAASSPANAARVRAGRASCPTLSFTSLKMFT